MNVRQLISAVLLLAMLLLTVSPIGAQAETRDQPHRHFHGLIRPLVTTVADAIGLEPHEILAELRAGSTLAAVVAAHDGDVDQVIAYAVSTLTAAINQRVAEGSITQERADLLLSNLEDTVTRAMHGEWRQQQKHNRTARGVLALAAEQTGLQPRNIVRQLRDGKSLADILAEHGVASNAFIEVAVAQWDERLDQAVANGRITQEQADIHLQTFRDHLTDRVHHSGTPDR